MGDALQAFIQDQYRRNLRAGTIERRARVLRRLSAAMNGTPIHEATREHVETWVDSCSVTPRSRSVYLSVLHCFFEFCQREGLRDDDPTRLVIRPRARRLVPRPISDTDLAQAMEEAPPTMKAWLALGAFQGLRCWEIAGLRREDILENRRPPSLVVYDGKGGHQAVLPLNSAVTSALRVHGLPPSGYVFLMQDGRSYRPGTVSTYIARYFSSLGINATAHQLRHWYGSKVWAATKDIRVTQELMRHQDVKSTAIYTAWDRDLAVKAVSGLSV